MSKRNQRIVQSRGPKILTNKYGASYELLGDCIVLIVRHEGDFSSLAVEKDAMEEKCPSGKHSTVCIAYRCCVVRLKAFAEHVQGGGASASGVCSIPSCAVLHARSHIAWESGSESAAMEVATASPSFAKASHVSMV